jgi:hypothetical protein
MTARASNRGKINRDAALKRKKTPTALPPLHPVRVEMARTGKIS